MIQCQQCGQGNADQTQFCRFCGIRLALPQANQQTDFQQAPPRPYAWKTDEYQTQSEPRQRASNYQQSPLLYQQPAMMMNPAMAEDGKSRVAYILLGLFLGSLGIHNFYLGNTGKGITQLLLTLLLFWTVVVPIGVWIWTLVEVITVDRDANGNRMI